MRVGPRLKLPVPTERTGEGDAAKVRITLPTGTTAKMDAPDWERIAATFHRDLPGITPNGNGRSAKGYLRITLPPGIGERKGQQVMLSHLVLGLDEVVGRQVKYRDGNPLNLCRDNLKITRRGSTAPEAED